MRCYISHACGRGRSVAWRKWKSATRCTKTRRCAFRAGTGGAPGVRLRGKTFRASTCVGAGARRSHAAAACRTAAAGAARVAVRGTAAVRTSATRARARRALRACVSLATAAVRHTSSCAALSCALRWASARIFPSERQWRAEPCLAALSAAASSRVDGTCVRAHVMQGHVRRVTSSSTTRPATADDTPARCVAAHAPRMPMAWRPRGHATSHALSPLRVGTTCAAKHATSARASRRARAIRSASARARAVACPSLGAPTAASPSRRVVPRAATCCPAATSARARATRARARPAPSRWPKCAAVAPPSAT